MFSENPDFVSFATMIKNYTTSIPAEKSIAEIQKMLSRHGAGRVTLTYEEGIPVSLEFTVALRPGGGAQPGEALVFELPCRWKGVQGLLAKAEPRYRTKAHAVAVSWRILRDWTDAQMALLQAGLAELPEIMLPYMVSNDGRTLYEHYNDRNHGGANLLPGTK